MAHAAKHTDTDVVSTQTGFATDGAVERFAHLVAKRVGVLANASDRAGFVALTTRALDEARRELSTDPAPLSQALPVTKLKVSEVISQGLVQLSQASLYRAAENGRFYCMMPSGRSSGREFPAWQFVAPVPELIEPVLSKLAGLPASEIHAFWVTAEDDLNELSPAEILAGKPFESREQLHQSQHALLSLPASARLEKVMAVATFRAKGMAAIIG